MHRTQLILLTFLIVFSHSIFAQRFEVITRKTEKKSKYFTKESGKYLKEMKSFLEKTDKKKAKTLMGQFTEEWERNAFSEEQKKRIFTTSIALQKKRARAFPHFELYLKNLITFLYSRQDIENYNNWEQGLLYMLNKKKIPLSKVESYLKISYGLFSSNTIYYSPTTKWVVTSNNYRFQFSPDEKGSKVIKIDFDETDLVCYSKNDSANIYNTRGVFYPLDIIWKGKNGKVTWERAGFSKDKVFADLQDYEIDMTKSKYKADSITFINKHYFREPLIGSLEEKVLANVNPEKALYPKFGSYSKRFEIKNIYENIDYNGGFTMNGAKFIGSGSQEEDAYIYIYRNDTIFLTAASKLFILKKDRIISKNTAVTLRLDTDSIYHPGLIFQYLVAQREVSLIRDGEGMTRNLYYNTYHGLDMDFELLSWKIDDPRIEFNMIKGTRAKHATFESSNYFRAYRYDKLQGMDAVNPLTALKRFSKKCKSEKFSSADFANYMNISIDQIRHYLMRLAFMGIISYNYDTEEVVIKERLYNYINSRFGKKDYDVIAFASTPEKIENASLNLLNYDLKINGVEEIFLSDSQNVVIYPTDGNILIKRNLDFEFDGKIQAGLFTFYGKTFSFEYDNFKINLNNVDSLKFKVKTGKINYYGYPILANIKNTIENVTGDLLIDKPNNKSSVKKFPKYPIFNSRKDSYVFYDRGFIQDGVYSRDNFYFQIYPYTIDSLNTFSTEGLEFDGYFVSGGIFPPFEEKLVVQKDYSLGFIRPAPRGGYPMYGGKGTFTNPDCHASPGKVGEAIGDTASTDTLTTDTLRKPRCGIKMSNKGLRGDGELKYITSTTYSDDFVFFPDSMNTHAKIFIVEKLYTNIEFPSVEAEEVYIHWLPNEDELYAYKKEIPFTMFDEKTLLHGTVKVEPTGLSGWGKMEFENAELTSDLFTFGENTIDSDTCQFYMRGGKKDEFIFKTDNDNAHIDFIERNGKFQLNDQSDFVEFPQNQYHCYIDQFTWYMDKEQIQMSTSKQEQLTHSIDSDLNPTESDDILLEGSKFVSVHPKQDSLSFYAPTADYDLKDFIISANDVLYIKIADAKVFPGEGEKIEIEKKAIMRTLKNAKIIANNVTRYHTIYDATVNIFSRNDYLASGGYDYIDELNRKQVIHFDVVAVDTSIQTYATGDIQESENFTLSPDYSYIGKVRLDAAEEHLTFTGVTKISHECDMISTNWLSFSARINPEQIYIPVSDPLFDINKNRLFTSVMLTKDSAHIYSTFLSKRKKYSDIPVLSAKGIQQLETGELTIKRSPVKNYLYFDNNSKKYKISNKEKLVEFNLPGNYLSLQKNFCNIFGEGKINIGADFGQFKLTTVGNIIHNLEENEISLDLIIAMDFFFADKSLEIMTLAINDDPALSSVDMSRNAYIKGLAELIGVEETDKLISEISLYGVLKKIPKELKHTILLTDLKFEWNSETHSYRSVGQIGIGNILETQVNRFVDGYIEIIKKRGGDIFCMYLEIDPANWFFFRYRAGQMLGVSSYPEFNTIITEIKPKNRKLKVKRGQMPYSIYIATERQKNMFLKRFVVEEEEDDESEEDEE